jgi:hypothetical protein
MNALDGIVVHRLIRIVNDPFRAESPTEPHVEQIGKVIGTWICQIENPHLW